MERDEKGRFKKGVSACPEKTFVAGRAQQEIARMGANATNRIKKEKRLLAEICNRIGALKSDSELLEHLGLDADERTKDAAVVTAMYMAAEAGDSKAAAWIRDTKGESKIQVDVAPVLPIDTSDLYFNEDDEQPDSLLP